MNAPSSAEAACRDSPEPPFANGSFLSALDTCSDRSMEAGSCGRSRGGAVARPGKDNTVVSAQTGSSLYSETANRKCRLLASAVIARCDFPARVSARERITPEAVVPYCTEAEGAYPSAQRQHRSSTHIQSLRCRAGPHRFPPSRNSSP
jgi:hypothetical protein